MYLSVEFQQKSSFLVRTFVSKKRDASGPDRHAFLKQVLRQKRPLVLNRDIFMDDLRAVY